LLRAIIFDFDGIIVDTEPTIYRVFLELAAKEGFTLSQEEYFRDYLALHDRGVLNLLFRRNGGKLTDARLEELLEWKNKRYMEVIQDGLPPLPGALDFIEQVSRDYPLAIATGSIRSEVSHLLGKIGLTKKFPVLVSADDFGPSKPDPACFLLTLEQLRRQPIFSQDTLQATECLVIEDSPAGVAGAGAAGMRSLGLAHSVPLEALGVAAADWRAENYAAIDWNEIVAGFSEKHRRAGEGD